MSNLNFVSHFLLDPKFSYQKERQKTSQLCLLYFILKVKCFREKKLKKKRRTFFFFPVWHKSVMQCAALDIWFESTEAPDGHSKQSLKEPVLTACECCSGMKQGLRNRGTAHQNMSLPHLSNFQFPVVTISDPSADSYLSRGNSWGKLLGKKIM